MIEYFEGFDYGGEVADKENNYILWPVTGRKTCLVDADLLPYRVGFVIDEMQYLEAKNLVESGHYKEIRDTPQFESAFDQLCATLNRWIRACSCDSAILYTTKSSDNFRLSIAYTDEYKGQRSKEKPPFFNELKDEMESILGCILAIGNEADDRLSIKATEFIEELGVDAGSKSHKELCNYTIASSDKDSAITTGENYNPDTGKLIWVDKIGTLTPKYKNAMVKKYEYQGTGVFWKRGANAGQEKTKRVLVGEKPSSAMEKLRGHGLMFFYSQLITGDTADNYSGLKGLGNTAAYETLINCKSERELYTATLGLYKTFYGEGLHWCPHFKGTEKYYDSYQDANNCPPPDWSTWKGRGAWLSAYDRLLEQGRLAWMQQFDGEIWRKEKGRVIDANDLEFWKCK